MNEKFPIPNGLLKARGLVVAVTKGDTLFITEVTLGDGSAWNAEDGEMYQEYDGYILTTDEAYAPSDGRLFAPCGGGMFMFSSKRYPDWHDAIMPALMDAYGGENGMEQFSATVLAAAE